MQASSEPAAQIPPEFVRYRKGAPPENQDFDFFIGDWNVSATRYKPDGAPLLEYKASWSARHLNDGRMIIDEFKALAPDGQAISSFVTLRTYSEVSHRWEMAGLGALQPAGAVDWHGQWKQGEFQSLAIGKDPTGHTMQTKVRFFEIHHNQFSWQSFYSLDGGLTWTLAASLLATRIPANPM